MAGTLSKLQVKRRVLPPAKHGLATNLCMFASLLRRVVRRRAHNVRQDRRNTHSGLVQTLSKQVGNRSRLSSVDFGQRHHNIAVVMVTNVAHTRLDARMILRTAIIQVNDVFSGLHMRASPESHDGRHCRTASTDGV